MRDAVDGGGWVGLLFLLLRFSPLLPMWMVVEGVEVEGRDFVAAAVDGAGRHDTPCFQLEQRSRLETPDNAEEMCSPHPTQVALPQLGHDTRLHIALT